MFKSVFTKYMASFMLIILISFLFLTAIIGSMLTNYSNENRRAIADNSCNVARQYLENRYVRYQDKSADFDDFVINNSSDIQTSLSMFVKYAGNLTIIVSDLDGNILIADKSEKLDSLVSRDINEAIISDVLDDGYIGVNDLGVYKGKMLARGLAVKDINGTPVGLVFSISSNEETSEFVQIMIKTIIMASLWVFLATIIAVYFISDRMIGPLKEMSQAAKSFAKGKFDVRVPVRGRDEVAELAVAFNNMAASLANNEDMRRTFLANVSHDLRTPMTTISGFIDSILDGAIPKEKEEYYLKLIQTEIRRLSRLVYTLLDISRIQAGDRKFTPTSFDICEMARLILFSFEQKINEKKLDVEFECDEENMYVRADRDAIYQILYNICDNGIKFAKDEGKYIIRITEKDKKVFVSVYNEGRGIPENELPYVFDRFYKGDRSRSLDKTGVGLGLYIAKTIIDAHNEEIWVNSVYGEYCEFVFTLPKSKETKAKEREELREKNERKGPDA